MKRCFAVVLTTLFLLSASCGESGSETEGLTDSLKTLDRFTAEAVVTAEFADRTVNFRLDCAVADGCCGVTVLEPAEIAGIEVSIAPGGVTAGFDGASFEVGEPGGVKPVTAVAELARLFTSAVPAETGVEQLSDRRCLTAVYRSGEDETRVWLDGETKTPVMAEFFSGGVRTLSCEFVSFVIGGS